MLGADLGYVRTDQTSAVVRTSVAWSHRVWDVVLHEAGTQSPWDLRLQYKLKVSVYWFGIRAGWTDVTEEFASSDPRSRS